MNELKIFNSPEFGQVRTLTIDGEPWFVGKDVVVALGYSKDSANYFVRKYVDSNNRKFIETMTNGGKQRIRVISKDGIKGLIRGSDFTWEIKTKFMNCIGLENDLTNFPVTHEPSRQGQNNRDVKDMAPVEYQGIRVLTTEQLAEAYECEPKRISENFKRNEGRFEAGKHYYKLEGAELKAFKDSVSTNPQFADQFNHTPAIYLWTRRGASRHSKMLGTDKAWEMFDALEENYFNPKPKELTGKELMARALLEAQTVLAEKDATIAKQSQIIGELKPMADYTDHILQNKGLVTITQIAKDYGMSGKAMNEMLHKFGVIYKLGGQWLLYSKYQNKGYTHSETINIKRRDGSPDVVMNTKWTQKGRLFLYQLLKKHGVLPMIERDDQEAGH